MNSRNVFRLILPIFTLAALVSVPASSTNHPRHLVASPLSGTEALLADSGGPVPPLPPPPHALIGDSGGPVPPLPPPPHESATDGGGFIRPASV